MVPKRPLPQDSTHPAKNPKLLAAKREDAVKRARERIAQLKAKQTNSQARSTSPPAPLPNSTDLSGISRLNDKPPSIGRGLNVELHPLLTGEADISSVIRPVDNPNLTKFNKRDYQVNPYLDNLRPSRHKRELKFNEKGKYMHEGDELRKRLAVEAKLRKEEEEKRAAGLLPDLSIKEDAYYVSEPPSVEWWDEPLLVNKSYSGGIKEEGISIYIQHPVPINAPWERHLPPMKPMYLTKKEMKRIRRIDRAEKYKELQDKIQLGLEPAPKPKIKLSNLMSALTNEAIKDPTKVEKRVLKEVEERKKKHLEDNESRKLTKEERHEKIHLKNEKDLAKGFHTAVLIINKLEHPSHKFKLDINAKQLELFGTLLYTEKFVLCIVEGSERNVNFYKKLLLRRIKWDESTVVEGKEIDLTGNTCQLLWEGQLKELHFKKWSIFRARDAETAVSFLSRFNLEHYYTDANAKLHS
jgi:U4/U6 small nuclear ribonucleoprotein PRP3